MRLTKQGTQCFVLTRLKDTGNRGYVFSLQRRRNRSVSKRK